MAAPRILIAGMGNVLRRDDGFGVEVARRLAAAGNLPETAHVVEVGIGGVHLVQELMNGYDVLIVIDALDGSHFSGPAAEAGGPSAKATAPAGDVSGAAAGPSADPMAPGRSSAAPRPDGAGNGLGCGGPDDSPDIRVLEVTVPNLADWPAAAREDFLADMHYATPSKAMILAKALGVLPAHSYIVGCEPDAVDDLGIGLTDRVAAAVNHTLDRLAVLVAGLQTERPV